MAFDVPHLRAPAAIVHAKGFGATVSRHLIKARLDDAQQRAD
jgi:hypothetical protein